MQEQPGRDYKSYCEARYLIETTLNPSEDDGCAVANIMVNTDGLTCMFIWDILNKHLKMLFVTHAFIAKHMSDIVTTPGPVRDAIKEYRDMAYHKEKTANNIQYQHFLAVKRFLTSNKVLSVFEAEEGEG